MPEPGSLRGPYAGDLFLSLARQGRLVLEPDQADRVIADLRRTLELLTTRLRLVHIWQQLPGPALDNLPAELARSVVDAVFVEQLAPGQLERAIAEMPKYISALERAKRVETAD